MKQNIEKLAMDAFNEQKVMPHCPDHMFYAKDSTTFPKRLSASKGGTTGVRAIMKAAAANDGFAEITRAAGLDGRVNHLNPTVYPVGAPLRASRTQFINNGLHYHVI